MSNEQITPRQLTDELLRLSKLLDEAHDELVFRTKEWSELEDAYRCARATSYIASSGTVGERTAYQDKATSRERRAAHLAEGLKVAALEAVRSRRAQLSAIQTLCHAVRSEIEMGSRYQ